MLILIPAYEPDERLPRLVAELGAVLPDARVLVVDDGSGAGAADVFAEAAGLGAELIGSTVNRGKGAALKAGFAHAAAEHPGRAVVTADADGQHTPADIAAVAGRLAEHEARGEESVIVLGGRRFSGAVPLRSRLGNAVSRGLFRLSGSGAVHDTQTGLRGFPAALLPWLAGVGGSRFEYEARMLTAAGRAGIRLDEIPIETVYLDENRGSHFRPFADSVRVVLPLAGFAAVSLASFAIDTVALLALQSLTGVLLLSVLGARLLSGAANFLLNRRFVFRPPPRRLGGEAVRYAVLASALLATNYVWLAVLTSAGIPLLAAKLATEAVLFVVGYAAQRRLVFARPAPQPDTAAGTPRRIGLDIGAR